MSAAKRNGGRRPTDNGHALVMISVKVPRYVVAALEKAGPKSTVARNVLEDWAKEQSGGGSMTTPDIKALSRELTYEQWSDLECEDRPPAWTHKFAQGALVDADADCVGDPPRYVDRSTWTDLRAGVLAHVRELAGSLHVGRVDRLRRCHGVVWEPLFHPLSRAGLVVQRRCPIGIVAALTPMGRAVLRVLEADHA